MIILRQKVFNQIDVDFFTHFYDDNGNLLPFKDEDEKNHFEMVKKRFPDVWDRFVKSGYKGTKDPEEKRRVRKEQEDREKWKRQQEKEYQRSQGRGSSSSNSGSGSGYNSGFGGYSWNQNQNQKSQEDIKKEEEKRKHDEKEHRTANRLFYGAVAANILGTGAEELVKGIRHDKINDKVGYDSRIKAADRRAIEEYKRESSGNKKLLMDLADDKKSEEEKKKSKRKYVAKKTLGGVLRNIPRGAAIGSYIASPGINYYVVGQNDEGKRAKKGFLIGGAITGAGGGLFNYISSKHKTDRLKNMKSKERRAIEKDRLRVGSGTMTEHEFIRKQKEREEER